MSGGLKGQPCRGVIFVLAAMIAGLGWSGPLSASETIVCDELPLIAQTPETGAQLGWSLSASGGWLATGANLDNRRGEDAGAVALYSKPQPGARPDLEIAPADLRLGDRFGSSVSISNGWLAVGAPVGDGKVQDSGVVYLFQLVGTTWVQQVKLDATDAKKGAQFGFSVSLSNKTLVVGAPSDSDRGSSAGAAYVFEMGDAGWKQTAKLLANDGRPFDEFGSAVAVSGGEIVIGAPFADDLHAFQNFGAAYVFKRTTNGGWTLEENGKLTAGTFRTGNIQFGFSVAIEDDRIVVGAPGDDQRFPDAGSAYVFERNGTSWASHLLTAEDPGQGKQLGTAVQIAGGRVFVGSPFDSEGGKTVGAVYIFGQSSGVWTQRFKIIRHEEGGAYGQSIAILGDQVAFGGFQHNAGAATSAGAVAVCSSGEPPGPLICTKTGPGSVNAGELVTYKLQVTNQGDTRATGVVVDDPTPQGLTFVRAGKPCESGFPCSLGTIGPHDFITPFEVTFRVPDSCSTPGSIRNSATVTSDSGQTRSCSADPTAVLRRPKNPLLSCDKQGPGSAKPGDVITYTITVSNTGCAAAANVKLSDVTPPGLTYMSGPCVQSSCNLGTIGPGQSLSPVMVKFKVPTGCAAPTSIINTATVTGSNAAQQTCSLPTSVSPQADLGVSASAPPQVSGGDSFKFSVVVTNAGPHTAQGATADVTIGASAIVDPTPNGCNPVPNQPNHFTCLLGDIPCGSSKPLDFMVRAPACAGCTAGNPIDFTVEAKSQTPDPTVPDIAKATVQVTCLQINNLTITKTDNPDPVVPGQGVVYTITVKNTCASAVSGAVVEDDFPVELRKVLWCRGMGCTPNLPPPLRETVSLAAGEARIYRLSGIVQPMCSGVLHNKATITPPAGVCDDPADNQRIEDTQVVANGVLAFCEGISGPMMELTPITKTLLLINCGPANQADNPGDEFTDVLPAGLTLTGASATSGVASTSGNTATWNGAIPAGGSVTITINANINAGTAGMTLCNQATIAYDADGNGTNESTGFSDDPDEPGPADPCCFRVIAPGIPALSWDGLAAFALLLAGLAIVRLRRRLL